VRSWVAGCFRAAATPTTRHRRWDPSWIFLTKGEWAVVGTATLPLQGRAQRLEKARSQGPGGESRWPVLASWDRCPACPWDTCSRASARSIPRGQLGGKLRPQRGGLTFLHRQAVELGLAHAVSSTAPQILVVAQPRA